MQLAPLTLVALLGLSLPQAAFARDLTGKWAQADPGLRKWFGEQQVPSGPSKGMSCCSAADGVNSDERWTVDHFQAQFTIEVAITKELIQIPWTDVPAEAVLTGPFPKTAWQTIVWWWAEWEDSRAGMIKRGTDGKLLVHVRCFKPSAQF